MKTREVTIPTFHYSKINKSEDGSHIPLEKALEDNTIAALTAGLGSFGPDKDFVLIVTKEKDGDDYRLAMACMGCNDEEAITATLSGSKNIPNIVISKKPDFIEVVKRVLKNILFS